MDGATGQVRQRTLTPAVLASVIFLTASAVFAITFVASRGGLEMPIASRVPVAAASPEATLAEPPTPSATPAPVATGPAVPTATAPPTTPLPTDPPPSQPPPTGAPPSFDPDEPLLSLPGCPGRPGCFLYVAQRGDTLSGVVTRYRLSIAVVLALNPELSDPRSIATGTTLYLGSDPFARLDPCPDETGCSVYVVLAGDSLGEIAARYGLTIEEIRDQNPGMPRPLQVGQVIELPHP